MNEQNEQFDRLWTDYLEGELDADGVAALDSLLLASEDLRNRALDLYGEHRLLGWLLKQDDESQFVAATSNLLHQDAGQFVARVQERVLQKLGRVPDRNSMGACEINLSEIHLLKSRRRIATIAMALGVLVAVGWMGWIAAKNSSPLAKTVPPAVPLPEELALTAFPPTAIALLVNEDRARFASRPNSEPVVFPAGDYELSEGIVHLRFSSGADVVIPAPAQFSIEDGLNIQLTRGTIRAVVPPSAHGFTVGTPDVLYEDLGTEFGITVQPDRDVNEVHIFDGEVDVKSPQGELLASLKYGESARVSQGRIVGSAEPVDPDQFPTPEAIRFGMWKATREALARDPDLLCYFPFETGADETVLKDATGHLDGEIQGARWVTGRWPGKQALLFDRRGDRVTLEIPGEYRQLTIATWLWVDRIDHSLNAIFNTVDWTSEGIHFQFTRQAHPHIGFYGNENYKFPPGTTTRLQVPRGRWCHLCAVINLDEHRADVYLDGTFAHHTPIATSVTHLRPGRCSVGGWINPHGHPESTERSLCGRIDEFTIWKRALTADEVLQCAKKGQPAPENVMSLSAE
ncbi:LamG-like jellyroll fold domain-containing protein [Planctomicrobium sp. SH664]|uniref:LamG-like jellyroll fold domain-containing protein n=1 Tax=Planctomicrobium sp. SH664 TaxID=3448125 RepID=UPI003F5C1230